MKDITHLENTLLLIENLSLLDLLELIALSVSCISKISLLFTKATKFSICTMECSLPFKIIFLGVVKNKVSVSSLSKYTILLYPSFVKCKSLE